MAAGPEDRLESWKEIAAYLRRSVRTVRRWERDEGLPVHRHLHRKLGSVYAAKSEIDAWRETLRGESPPPPPQPGASARTTIAVLPFANLSVDPDNEYFAEGLTEEVTNNLSRVAGLRVTSRTSAKAASVSKKSVKDIASRLGVRYVVEGSVRRAGRRLRISAQLIDAAEDNHVWGDTYDGTLEDVFAIQEGLARLIVDALEMRLTSEEERLLTERPIDSLPAYECYLRARHEAWKWRKDAIDRAVHLLNDALSIIGENARLYATLGFVQLQYREAGIDFSEQPILAAEDCAAKVAALDVSSPAGLQLRGWIEYSRGLVQDATGSLKRALAGDPNNADALLLLSNCYLIAGRVDVARPLIADLLAIDPLTPLTRCMPAWADILEGNLTAAIPPYRQMYEMDPSNPMARLFYVWVLVLNGRAADARRVADEFQDETGRSMPATVAAFLADAAAGQGKRAAANLTPEIEEIATSTDVLPRFLAHGYALAGMPDQAIRWIEVAVGRGFINYPFLARHDPLLAPLRDDARYQRLLAAVHERWQRFQP